MSPHLNFCVDLIFPKKNVSNTFGEEELEAQGVRLLTWSNMTGCSTYGRRHLRFTRLGKYPGKSEITNLGLEVVVKQDVAGLDVAVDDGLVVHVAQASRSVGGDANPRRPVQQAPGLVQPLVQATVLHILVDQQASPDAGDAAEQGDEVGVAHKAQCTHLSTVPVLGF